MAVPARKPVPQREPEPPQEDDAEQQLQFLIDQMSDEQWEEMVNNRNQQRFREKTEAVTEALDEASKILNRNLLVNAVAKWMIAKGYDAYLKSLLVLDRDERIRWVEKYFEEKTTDENQGLIEVKQFTTDHKIKWGNNKVAYLTRTTEKFNAVIVKVEEKDKNGKVISASYRLATESD